MIEFLEVNGNGVNTHTLVIIFKYLITVEVIMFYIFFKLHKDI